MIPRLALIGCLCAALGLSFAPISPLAAKPGVSGARTVITTSWVEEWDPAAQRWVRVSGEEAAPLPPGFVVKETIRQEEVRFVAPAPAWQGSAAPAFLAQYGPFRVLDARRAALVGGTDITSPRQFEAMLRDWPQLAVLEMIDAPGTSHDLANLALGRKIRAAGLATHVPAGGSVRSGAVELFLAGREQTIAPGARFAVHSWMDSRGLEPRHFAEDAPENRLYLDYYEEMGMAPAQARAFYAMTNSVPHSGALWLDAAAMQAWVAGAPAPEAERPAAPPPGRVRLASRHTRPLGLVRALAAQAARAPAPMLGWSELSAVTLARLDARLDSGPIFP